MLGKPSASFRSLKTALFHSFILNIYIAPLQENYSEALPTPARLNKAVLRVDAETNIRILVTTVSSLWVSRTGSASDWCAQQEPLYKCIDTIQNNNASMFLGDPNRHSVTFRGIHPP